MATAKEKDRENAEDTSIRNGDKKFRIIPVINRLKVVVPCVIVMLLLAIYISSSKEITTDGALDCVQKCV
ncbi:MAG: hypothetical protein FVQ84_14180 [Planctomycetes bacterium]|nr:hypothetical protein [Planctomycetota bacterium]